MKAQKPLEIKPLTKTSAIAEQKKAKALVEIKEAIAKVKEGIYAY